MSSDKLRTKFAKMELLHFTIFLLSAVFLTVNADNTEDIKLLKSQVKMLQSWRNLFSSYCGIHAAGKCGPCLCRDDYRLPEKYFCDCRNQPVQRDCLEHRNRGYTIDGLYTLTMNGHKVVNAYCDQTTDGGGWTVIQRRIDGSINFFRRWKAYKEGFGQLQREHWLGNENIHLLTAQAMISSSEAMIQLKIRGQGEKLYTNKYEFIQIDAEHNNYFLHVKKPSGDFNPNYFTDYNHRTEFSTYDRDNDKSSTYHCAKDYLFSGWWTNGAFNNACTDYAAYTNVNGPYDELRARTWYNRICWAGSNHPTFTEMKIRRLVKNGV